MALSRSSKRFLLILLVIVGLVVGAVGGGLLWLDRQLSGDPGPGDPVEITVERGISFATVADQLVDADVVSNARLFRFYAGNRGADRELTPGTYAFETGMGIDEAIDVLLAGPGSPDSYRFTVPEGLTVEQTLAILAEASPYEVEDLRAVLDERREAGANGEGLLELPDWVPPLDGFGADVREPYEGLLFPLTYEVVNEAEPIDLLQIMVDQLAEEVAAIPQEQVTALEEAGYSRYDALIIASLVEEETKVAEERPTVSGVIRNRLVDEQLLQIDATVLYAVGEHQAVVTQDMLATESAYNTYQVPGLPPTPISGFGVTALQAAFTPEDVPFRYYVLRAPECDGTHVFAETLDEHNRNVAAYRNAGRCG